MSFLLQKLAKFSSNTGKVHFEGLVHLLIYIRSNKTLGLKYYADIKYAPLSNLLRQSNINNENQFRAFYDSSRQDCLDTGKSTVAYVLFYQGGKIDHGKHVPGPDVKTITESEYNAAFTTRMALAHFRIIIHGFFNKDPDIVSEEYPLIILYRKSALCMGNNGNDTNHKRHISRRVKNFINGDKFKMYNI